MRHWREDQYQNEHSDITHRHAALSRGVRSFNDGIPRPAMRKTISAHIISPGQIQCRYKQSQPTGQCQRTKLHKRSVLSSVSERKLRKHVNSIDEPTVAPCRSPGDTVPSLPAVTLENRSLRRSAGIAITSPATATSKRALLFAGNDLILIERQTSRVRMALE